MSDKIIAPFTQEQVEALNRWQHSGFVHGFTCGSPKDVPQCFRAQDGKKKSIADEGYLLATEEGWVCGCGAYSQNWAWKSMLEVPESIEEQLTKLMYNNVRENLKIQITDENGTRIIGGENNE